MTTAISNVDDKTLATMDDAIEECSLSKLAPLRQFQRTAKLANGMKVLRGGMTGPLFEDIKGLANTKLGFLTDRPPGAKGKDGKQLTPYPDHVLRDAIIEGMLRGASIVGNEINVIAGNCYLTKQYFERQLQQWPGLTELRVVEGVPTTSTSAGGALVSMRASWKLNGHPDEMICDKTVDGDYRIPVRVNSQMGVDAILGKARRKLYAKVVARISGSTWVAEQAEADGDVIDVEAPRLAQDEPQATKETEESVDAVKTILDGTRDKVAATELCMEVDTIQAEARGWLLDAGAPQSDHNALREMCDSRREQIKSTRGERSNQREPGEEG